MEPYEKRFRREHDGKTEVRRISIQYDPDNRHHVVTVAYTFIEENNNSSTRHMSDRFISESQANAFAKQQEEEWLKEGFQLLSDDE
jgi:hypothetical protein